MGHKGVINILCFFTLEFLIFLGRTVKNSILTAKIRKNNFLFRYLL